MEPGQKTVFVVVTLTIPWWIAWNHISRHEGSYTGEERDENRRQRMWEGGLNFCTKRRNYLVADHRTTWAWLHGIYHVAQLPANTRCDVVCWKIAVSNDTNTTSRIRVITKKWCYNDLANEDATFQTNLLSCCQGRVEFLTIGAWTLTSFFLRTKARSKFT